MGKNKRSTGDNTLPYYPKPLSKLWPKGQYNCVPYDYNSKSSESSISAGPGWFKAHGEIISVASNKQATTEQLNGLPKASDISDTTNDNTPTLSSMSSESNGLSSISSKSDGTTSITLSGLSSLSSPTTQNPEKVPQENVADSAAKQDTDESDIEEVPVPRKPTPPLV